MTPEVLCKRPGDQALSFPHHHPALTCIVSALYLIAGAFSADGGHGGEGQGLGLRRPD